MSIPFQSDQLVKLGSSISRRASDSNTDFVGAAVMMLVLHMCWLKVIERSSVNVTSEYVDVRFTVGLPARGRSVLGEWAYSMLVKNLPNYVREGMVYSQQVRIFYGN